MKPVKKTSVLTLIRGLGRCKFEVRSRLEGALKCNNNNIAYGSSGSGIS